MRYRGPWPLPGGEAPVWPAGSGKRVYAYLSAFPGLPRILETLRATCCPTIVSGRIDRPIQDRLAAANVRFETRWLDLRQVAAECDLAVLNGAHATTITFHLAGKPVLHAPIFFEQGINATNTMRLGAGMIAFPRGVDRTAEQLRELLENPSYTDAARRFAARYAGFSADEEIADAVRRLDELASNTI
jgi:UDP:flavonoid glycosyltransferase YjiC (YdhE family)